ncbi:MAG: hypothetical protein ACXV8I_09520 [Methylobacter sp.]
MAADCMTLLGPGFNTHLAYPLSVLTQCFMFFKYLWAWIAPSPAWLSVDMPQAFAKSLWSWPEVVGLIRFILYPIVAIRLLLQKGVKVCWVFHCFVHGYYLLLSFQPLDFRNVLCFIRVICGWLEYLLHYLFMSKTKHKIGSYHIDLCGIIDGAFILAALDDFLSPIATMG